MIKDSNHRARLWQCQACQFASCHGSCSFGRLPRPREPPVVGPRDTDWPAWPFWTSLPTSGKEGKKAFVRIVVAQNAQGWFCIQKCIVRVIPLAERREENPINRPAFQVSGWVLCSHLSPRSRCKLISDPRNWKNESGTFKQAWNVLNLLTFPFNQDVKSWVPNSLLPGRLTGWRETGWEKRCQIPKLNSGSRLWRRSLIRISRRGNADEDTTRGLHGEP